jgi:hypothetical protein
MKQRLKTGHSDNYNWQTRVKWYPAGWGFNKRVLGNMHSRLHYLACHAPKPIRKRWQTAHKVFMNKHFGDAGRASVRYLNKWSCHSWM